jgi:hypothetical protein
MRKQAVCSITLIFILLKLNAQIDAGLFRYPDVSENQIVFSYANDLWLVLREERSDQNQFSPGVNHIQILTGWQIHCFHRKL